MGFKVGDWAIEKSTGEIKQIKIDICEDEKSKLALYGRLCEPWQPEKGELCCKKFTSKCFVVGPYGIPGFTEEHLEKGHLEPFIGKPSSFIEVKE